MKKILVVAAMAFAAAFLPGSAKAAASNNNEFGRDIAAVNHDSLSDASKCGTVVIIKQGDRGVIISVPDDVVIVVVPGRK